jgi:hypothetical protein
MADDAIRYLGVPARRIAITGPVQYDHYFAPVRISREDFLRSKGLDPARPTVIFAGGINITRYFEMYRLLVASCNGARRRPWNVVFRVYPSEKLLGSPEWKVLEQLLAAAEGVYVSNSVTTSSDNLRTAELKGDLARSAEVDELHALLSHGDVLINLFSTISLESALMDLPTIHLGYDEHTFGHRYLMSARGVMRLTHVKRALDMRAARVPESAAALQRDLEAYLADRSLDRDERRAYAESECGPLDGKASDRLAALLQQVARPDRGR